MDRRQKSLSGKAQAHGGSLLTKAGYLWIKEKVMTLL
jgi:hypothetical protein